MVRFLKTDLSRSKSLYQMIGFVGTVFPAVVESIFEVISCGFRRTGIRGNEHFFIGLFGVADVVYLRVVCPLDKEVVQDAAGNVEEEIYIYTMQAEPTFLGTGMMNLKIDVETSDEIIFTYILKFADKDVKITNGKVVE